MNQKHEWTILAALAAVFLILYFLAGGYPGLMEELKPGKIWARLSKSGHSSRGKSVKSRET